MILLILIFVVALLHLGFLALEMFYWTKPLGLKIFRQSLDQAKASQQLAANQGLYNGFLAVGLLWSLVHPREQSAFELQVFFLLCVMAAGAYGAWTVNRRILYVQALPALLALLFAGSDHFLAQPSGQKVVFAASKKECFTGAGTPEWKYCVHVPESGNTNGDLVYHLHGRGQDEHQWNDDTFYTGQIQEHWSKKNLQPPMVVSVSFGKTWLLTPGGFKSESGLLDVFTKKVIPEIEERMGKPKRRIVFGESMGGVNSLVVGLREVGVFDKVGALCPPIYKMSPFSSSQEIDEFLQRTGANKTLIRAVVGIGRSLFADEDEWKSASPLHLVESISPEASPELYVSAGLYDRYGNFEGSELLANQARSRGMKIEWRPLYGGHCAIDVPSIAEFLVR